jgi:FtsH-binding integral membrane protein
VAKKTKKKTNYAKLLLPWIIVAVMGYTIAAFILQFYTQVEISPTLTTAYYAFWTVEIISLAGIKTVKESKKRKETENEDIEN